MTNEIWNCDVLDGFKKLPDNSVDLCVTSPPYNCGIQYDSWNDSMEWEDYLEWTKSWLIEMKRVLKPDGRFAINHLVEMGIGIDGKRNAKRVSPQVEFYKLLQDLDLPVIAQPMWVDRTRSTMTAWGSWMSASSPYIYNPMEVILIGCKNTWKKMKPKDAARINTISKEDFIRGVSGVWDILPETRGLTKANFPIKLPQLCIELLTFQNDIVLDPFMGSGTTAVACINTGRQYIGFEISAEYHKIAEHRVKMLTIFR